jgi:hypothetical protein
MRRRGFPSVLVADFQGLNVQLQGLSLLSEHLLSSLPGLWRDVPWFLRGCWLEIPRAFVAGGQTLLASVLLVVFEILGLLQQALLRWQACSAQVIEVHVLSLRH